MAAETFCGQHDQWDGESAKRLLLKTLSQTSTKGNLISLMSRIVFVSSEKEEKDGCSETFCKAPTSFKNRSPSPVCSFS